MSIKIIKFDLPINGSKVTTLEALRDNLTDEIVLLARSGQLERWLQSRQMHEQAQAVAVVVSQHTEDKALFLALCALLEVEVHPDDARAIFDAPPEAGRHAKNDRNHLLAIIHKKQEAINIHKNEASQLAKVIYSILNSQEIRIKELAPGDHRALIEDYFKVRKEFRDLVSDLYNLLPSSKNEIFLSYEIFWNKR